MIGEIIEEAKTMEAEALRSEEEAQKAYDDFVAESKASIEAKTKDSVNKTEETAKAEAAKVEAEKESENNQIELEQLSQSKSELHQSCDFLLKNFDERQAALAEEVEALRQAKAIF